MDELFKNKYVILGAIICLILIFFMGKSYGKSKPPASVDLDGKVDSDGYLVSNLSDSDIDTLTARMFKDLDGINWLWFDDTHETELWNTASSLSDYDLSRVINCWNKNYYSKHNESLYDAIDSDYWVDDSESGAIKILLRKILRITNAG